MNTKSGITRGSDSEYLAGVVDSSPVALIALDRGLRIFMFNRAARELTGFGRDDAIGARVSRIIGPGRTREIIRFMRGRGSAALDGHLTRICTKAGGERLVRLTVTPITGRGKRLIGVLLAATDLREIREMQSKLLEAERLAAITETAISINHEINNPLCSILGYTQLILMDREQLDPDVVGKLEGIEEQIVRIQEYAERMSRITRPVSTDYVGGQRMLDVERSRVEDEGEDGSAAGGWDGADDPGEGEDREDQRAGQ